VSDACSSKCTLVRAALETIVMLWHEASPVA
jgi:hypothetical protein